MVLAHHRRRVVHFNVTEHPIAQWAGQQIIEEFPSPALGKVVQFPEVGGLHHHYERLAA